MLIGLIGIMLLVGGVVLAAWFAWFNLATRRRLKQHQREWDAIKATLEPSQWLDEYYEYITSLVPHPILGKCFPRM